jgi:hypothetical protein
MGVSTLDAQDEWGRTDHRALLGDATRPFNLGLLLHDRRELEGAGGAY